MRKVVTGFSVFVGSCVLLGICAEESQALPSFRWSQAGAIPGMTCVRIHEDADPHAWSDNFLCVGVKFPLTGNRDDAVANGRMGTSFTLTNGGRLTAVTNTRTGVRLAGFTGAVGIVLLNGNRQPIWASDTQSYGVDGCTIGRCKATVGAIVAIAVML